MAFTPCASRYLLVSAGSSVEIRIPSGRSDTERHGAASGTASTTRTGLPVALEYFSSPSETRSDRKSTRLNSSHLVISYAVFCLKKKKKLQVFFLMQKKKKKIKIT